MSMEIREVAPGDLIVAANVRREVALSNEFVASVKEHGVKVPVLVQEGAVGLEVVDGQRRTLAAVEAGLRVVPVVVQAPVADEAQRIVEQVVVNQQRQGLSVADQVEAVRDLALFGLSASAIAKRTGSKKAEVEEALKVAAVPAAVEAIREQQVSFENALLLAEVAEVDEEFAGELREKLSKGYTIAGYVRDWRFERAKAAASAELAAAGIEEVEPLGWQADDPRAIRDLYLDERHEVRLSDVDEAEMKKLAGDGLVGFLIGGWTAGNERTVQIDYGVRGWRERGLFGKDRSAYAQSGKPSTPEEAEALKAERRAARERSAAWQVATEARLAFLQDLLQRKTLPAGWAGFVAQHALKQGGPTQNTDEAMALLRAERTAGDGYGAEPLRRVLVAHPQKAAYVLLALALADWEGRRDFDRRGWQSEGVADYLGLLAGWGYELSEVERQVVEAA